MTYSFVESHTERQEEIKNLTDKLLTILDDYKDNSEYLKNHDEDLIIILSSVIMSVFYQTFAFFIMNLDKEHWKEKERLLLKNEIDDLLNRVRKDLHNLI